MKKLLLPIISVVALCGCKTPLMTPAQLTSTVSQGVQLGLSVYPQAEPEVAIARDVVCAEVGKTNVDPSAIIADLAKANITSSQAKIIVNGAVFVYNGVFQLLNTNSLSSAEPYLAALCSGLNQALPPNPVVLKAAHLK